MSSETEDSVNAGEDSHTSEMNGDVPSPTENGNNKENVTEDVIVEEKSDDNNSSKHGSTDKPRKDVGPSDDSSDDASDSQLKDKVEADDSVLVEDDVVIEEVANETNGDDKDHLDDGGGGEGKKGTGQRRMSLRPRSTPKKYVDVEESSDDDAKDPLATKDPLAIPLGKNSSTVLIRKSLSPTASVSVKPSVKPPFKIGKVTRPPPELIKAPPLHKLSVSPATTVTVVPRSKENANPGFVIVDTQSILTGKGPVAVNTVPASVTVSAVPPAQVTPKQAQKPAAPSASASASVLSSHKKTASSNVTTHSLPDPFEALGLADDSFIVEAPSFVVPYLIEKTAPQNLRKHIDTMITPKSKDKKAQDVIVLSEDESDDSTPAKNDKKEKDKDKEKDQDSADKTTTDKSSMKSEMEKSQSQTKTGATKEQDDYFSGPIGRFFLDIGLSLVQEYVQGDLLRVQKRKANKGSKISDPSLSVSALSKGLDITRAKNDPYRLPLRQCDRCNFKSESRLVMAQHWSTPFPIGYGSTARFGCHWCPFETKESHLVAAHIEAEHDLKSRASVDRLMHQCPLCPFEDNIKSKVTRHVLSCQKRYVPERNQEPPLDWEPPAKIPRIPPRNVRNFSSAAGAAGLAAAIAGAGGINASSLASYQMAASKGNAAFALPSFHPLLPKSALLNSLGYSVLPTAGQLAYLSNLTSTLQAKGGKGAAAAAAAVAAQTLAGLRLPAELHVVQGTAQQRSSTPPQTAQSKTGSAGGATYRQQSQSGQSTSSLFLSSSYPVANNQIYQQLLHGQGSATMSVLPATASKGLAVGGSKKNFTGSSSSSSAVSLVPGLVSTSGLTIQSSATPSPAANKTRSNQQPSISITPLPRTTSASNTSATAAATPAASNKPSLSVSPVTPATASAGNAANAANAATPLAAKPGQPTTAGQKGSAVCEICDGYIKDLEQLRHHMQWIHKVKIHPKMIHNRPPLNCQKCQCRFFTDQGLERHLLGSHGLVTSSMQEAANRGQDGGRCPICGKVHQWKLLSHVVKDHGLSLKPAHLSYKCTVCTATFTMYKLFENHVYTAHSVVARKVLDKDKEKDRERKPASGSANNSTSGLRINDEITIIPQPARNDTSSAGDQQNVCRSCHSSYDPAEVKKQLRRLDISASHIPGSDQKCASCLRLSSITRGEKRNRVDVIDLSDDEDHHHHQDGGGVMLPKSQVTITKVPAPKGYNSRNSKESSSAATVVVKRSRMDDHDSD